MTTYSHLLVITQRDASREALGAIFNTSGAAQMLLGYGDISLWILPNSKKSNEEAKEGLKAVSEIQNVSLVSLSQPINESEVKKVRQMLSEFEFNTEGINDQEFALYLNSLVKGKVDYYMDFLNERLPQQPPKLMVKLLKDHPDFCSKWLEEKPSPIESDGDREYTIDDFEIIHETFEETIDPFDEANHDNLMSGDKMESNDNEKIK